MIEEYNLNKNRHICNGLGENSSEYKIYKKWKDETSDRRYEENQQELYNWISQFIDVGNKLKSEYCKLLLEAKGVCWEEFGEDSPAIIEWLQLLENVYSKRYFRG